MFNRNTLIGFALFAVLIALATGSQFAVAGVPPP